MRLLSLLLPLLFLLSFPLLQGVHGQTTFPTPFPTAYSASVSLNFGTLNYSSSFDEYVNYTVYLHSQTSNALNITQLVQQRGRYVDRNTWWVLDMTNDTKALLISTANGDPTNITSCQYAAVEDPASNWLYFSLATGPTMAIFGSVLPLMNVPWTQTANVWLTDRNLNTNLWTMSTPVVSNYTLGANGVGVYTVTIIGSGADAYPAQSSTGLLNRYYTAFAELADMNLRVAESKGMVYQTIISSIQAYLSPQQITFPDGAAYFIPIRLVVTGQRQLNGSSDSSFVPFNNTFDWAAIQPVQMRYYNRNALKPPTTSNVTAGLCTELPANWVPPAILSASILAPSPVANGTHPPVTAFPPSFQATMEALLTLPTPGTVGINGPLMMSQFREFTTNADGTVTWDENNQAIQLIPPTATVYADWYQFNHTTTGGGSHWQITGTPGAAMPYQCVWRELGPANRSPIDYIHEQQLTKIYSMTNGTIYLYLWTYSHSDWARGIWCDVYLMHNVTAPSRTDGYNYTWTQSLYVTASGWQMQGRANSTVTGSPEANLPVMIITTGYWNQSGGVSYSFTDRVHFFTVYPAPNPFIYGPQGYGCSPAPHPSRPLFPNAAAFPSSYSTTVSFSQSTLTPGNLSAQPVTWSYTEYYQSTPPMLRLDGDMESVNSVQVFNLTSGLATLAVNPALDLGALGYGSAPDWATRAVTSGIGNATQCSAFTATSVQLANSPWFRSTVAAVLGLMAYNQQVSPYIGNTTLWEAAWMSQFRLEVPVPNSTDVVLYQGAGWYSFGNALINSTGPVLPHNFTYSLNVTDLGINGPSSSTLISYQSISVIFTQFMNYTATPLPSTVFAQPTAQCASDSYVTRFAPAMATIGSSIAYPGTQPSVPLLSTASGSFSAQLTLPLMLSSGDARVYAVRWYYQASGPRMERVDIALLDATDPGFTASHQSYIHVWSNPVIVPTSGQAETIYNVTGTSCAAAAYTPAASVLQNFANGAAWQLLTDSTQAAALAAVPEAQPEVINGIPCWRYTASLSGGGSRVAFFAVSGWTFFGRYSSQSLVQWRDSVVSSGQPLVYTVNVLTFDAEAPTAGVFAPLLSASQSPTCQPGSCAQLLTINSGLATPNAQCGSVAAATGASWDFAGLSNSQKLALGLVLGLFLPLGVCVAFCWWRRRSPKSGSTSSGRGRRPQRFDDVNDGHTLDPDDQPVEFSAPHPYGDDNIASVVRSISKQRSNGRSPRATIEEDDQVRMEDVQLSEDGESESDTGRRSGKKKKKSSKAEKGQKGEKGEKGEKNGKKKKHSRQSASEDSDTAIEMGGI